MADGDANNCSFDFEDPTTSQLLQAINGNYASTTTLVAATILSIITFIVFIEGEIFVCRKIASRRKVQLSFIMGIYPVFSATSLISLYVPRASLVARFTAQVYLSVSLLQFVMLITGYFKTRDNMQRLLKGSILPLGSPPLLIFASCCLPKIPITEENLLKIVRTIKAAVLQVAVLKPILWFVATVLWTNGSYKPGKIGLHEPFIFFQVASLLSTLMALNGIIILFRLCKEPLKKFKITPKFFTVQLALVLTTTQSILIAIFISAGVITCRGPFGARMRGSYIDNLLTVVEMFFFNIMATIWYRRTEGNVDPEEQLQRRYYAQLSSTYKVDPAIQIALGDETDVMTSLTSETSSRTLDSNSNEGIVKPLVIHSADSNGKVNNNGSHYVVKIQDNQPESNDSTDI
ncbi:organic solute transporter subunit alpha-like [Anneissia japonica]|uniref:organic solute transporter subunit alpha-like n=1 Tax=Anneissia japonica TaxID=1529436 RepID=UPI001425AB6D|nr:organic solute transporter subunit alpha-like [Anneissia japonica]XP_033115896.1 organic solute transporter subunit alpha-like [Anneissia japonica]XP_033115897.1 organic solute transporter subunit alpha-like [Anneissia japonica]